MRGERSELQSEKGRPVLALKGFRPPRGSAEKGLNRVYVERSVGVWVSGAQRAVLPLHRLHTCLTFWPGECPGLQCGALPCRCVCASCDRLCLPFLSRCWEDEFFHKANFIMKHRFVNSKPKPPTCHSVLLAVQHSAFSACPSPPLRLL